MDIKRKHKKITYFEDLEPGDVFIFPKKTGLVLMKIKENFAGAPDPEKFPNRNSVIINAVDLKEGYLHSFKPEHMVEPVKSTLILDEV